MKKLFVFILGLCLLAGCDSGSSSSGKSADTTQPEGVWVGRTVDDREGVAIIDKKGSCYMFYSAPGKGITQSLSGVVIGTGAAKDQTYTATGARDYYIPNASVSRLNVLAQFVPHERFTGVSSYPATGAKSTFEGFYSPLNEADTKTESIVGQFIGKIASETGMTDASFFVYSDGTISGSEQYGCTFSGTVTPKQKGNVFDFVINFKEGCILSGQKVRGVGIYIPDRNKLVLAAVGANPDIGFSFTGGLID